jgi:NAD(P)H-dependent FMN reductase
MRILGIAGSLRENSSNGTLLKIIASIRDPAVEFEIYRGLGGLPFFTPEYAFGMPGVLKNALDWTVSSGEFDKKPVAASPTYGGGDKAHASLLLVLGALSGRGENRCRAKILRWFRGKK